MEFNLNNKIVELLNKRGYNSEDELEEFLSKRPKKTYDPFLLPDMEAGVDLILSAIENDEKIFIYGDYDADGVTSVSLLMDVLKELTDKVSYYIPSRFDEGYGLNKEAIDKIRKAGADLIVTVDCGSVSYEEVEHAKAIGLNILVTDHHSMGGKIADCLLINPLSPKSRYPFKYLAGVGVAFKLAQAIVIATGLPKEVLSRNLDLVAIGTIGDVVPLVDENRTLVKYGLRAMRITSRIGLKLLMEKMNVNMNSINSERVAFSLVPPINASGRMKNAYGSAKLLQAKDVSKAEVFADEVVSRNNERKEEQLKLYNEIMQDISEQDVKDKGFLLLRREEAHEGVAGIVAGRLKDRFKVPVIIVTRVEDNVYKGTGRTVESINLYDMLSMSKEYYLNFGGHKAACGFSVESDNLDIIESNCTEYISKLREKTPGVEDELPSSDIILNADEIDCNLIEQIEMLEPFGRGNEKPNVEIKVIPRNISKMGSTGNYIRFGAETSQGEIKCVIFRNADIIGSKIEEGKSATLVGPIKRESFKGQEYIQMEVLDVK